MNRGASLLFRAAFFVAAGLGVEAKAVEITWIGDDGADYCDQANWDPAAPCPVNSAESTFHIIIPKGFTVNVDLSCAQCGEPRGEVDALTLEAKSWMSFAAGTSYSVKGQTSLSGGLWAEGGATFALGATAGAYSSREVWENTGSGTEIPPWEILKAQGEGTRLDLSKVLKIDAGFDDRDSQFASPDTNIQTILAADGGAIDFSGATEVVSPAGFKDKLVFVLGSGSEILLSSLERISSAGKGHVAFEAGGASLVIPALQQLTHVFFDVRSGANVVAGSEQVRANYSSRGIWENAGEGVERGPWDMIRAEGAGTKLDLKSVRLLDASFDDRDADFAKPDTNVQQITASRGATVDLSGVEQVMAPFGSGDRLEFLVGGQIAVGDGSTISLSSLQAITKSGQGLVSFRVFHGTLDLAKFAPEASVIVQVKNPTAMLEVKGDFNLGKENGGQVTLASQGLLKVSGNFLFDLQDPSKVEGRDGILRLNGSGEPQLLEVGGKDVGLDTSLLPEGSQNFGLGRLVVGEEGQSTKVVLQDAFDNGQRGGGREALYLFGLDVEGVRQDGLVILGGSTLATGGLKVYAFLGGQMKDLEAAFVSAVVQFPTPEFPGWSGTLDMTSGFSFIRGDYNTDGELNITDPIFFLARLFLGGAPGCSEDAGDSDDNGKLNISDAIVTLGHLFQGGPPLPEPFPSCGGDPTADSLVNECGAIPGCR